MFSYLAVVVGGSEPGVLWLICSREEAIEKVFPRLTPQEASHWMEWHSFSGGVANLSQSDSKSPAEELVVSEGFHPSHLGRNAVTFLVSAGGRDIVPHWTFYPFSGQWNGESPFLLTKLQVVSELEELSAPEFIGPIEGLSNFEWDRVSGRLPGGSAPGTSTDEFMDYQRQTNGAPYEPISRPEVQASDLSREDWDFL